MKLFVIPLLGISLLITSCGGSESTNATTPVSVSEDVIEEIGADEKLDAKWKELVAEEPELTSKCEPFIKYRIGRNEVLETESLLASISASQSVVDDSGNNNVDVKISLTKQRQNAERQKGLAYYWFSPWQTEVEDLIQNNKKLTKECNFTDDELLENMRK